MKKIVIALICFAFGLPAFSQEGGDCCPPSGCYSDNCCSPSWLYLGAYGGYGVISGAYHSDGQVAQARLGIGAETAPWKQIVFGAEVGIQSGNTMRLQASSEVIALAGGLPLQATLKPFLDFLIATEWQFVEGVPLSLLLKWGVAYRQLELNDRTSSRDHLKKWNGELQAGLGYQLTQHGRLVAYYQRIFSESTAGIKLTTDDEITISQIPTQQGGFIGVEFSL